MRVRRAMLRIVACTTLVGAMLAGGARPAGAHAQLAETVPAADVVLEEPPAAVELRFTERVDASLGGISVVAPDGGRADTGAVEQTPDGTIAAVPIDASRRGTYTVAWSVVSADGHPISGSFVFSVGEVTGAAEVMSPSRTALRFTAGVSRTLAYAGTIALAGGLLYALTVARGRAVRPAALLVGGGLAALVGASSALVLQVALAAGIPLTEVGDVLGDAVADARFARLALLRAGFALVGLVGAVIWARRERSKTAPWIVGVGSGGLLVVPALAGHAWTADQRWLAVAVDAVHLAAASAWIGGLGALAMTLSSVVGRLELARGYSRAALAAAALVVATGVASVLLQIEGFRTLIDTGWGRLLLLKIALVAGLLALGWVNRQRLVPRADEPRLLLAVVRVELVVALAVVAVTAALVQRPPEEAAATSGGPFSATVALEAPGGPVGDVQVDVVPAVAGANDVHLYFFDTVGGPLGVDAIELTVAREGVPPRRVEVTPIAPSHASAYGVNLPTPATWVLDLTVVRAGEPATATVEVPIP